jgi:WD40 repeat protein
MQDPAAIIVVDGKLAVRSAAFVPGDRSFITASVDRSVRLWDIDGGTEIRRFIGHQGGVLAVAASPDGSKVISAGYDKTLRVWDLATALV